MNELSDEQLLAQIAAQDETALLELHARYAASLSAVARRILHTADEVVRCVEDSFVVVWERAEQFDASCHPKTWLVTTCHRLALNQLRQTTLEPLPLQQWQVPTQQSQQTSKPSEAERELIELAYFRGHSHHQVARLTGQDADTVATRLQTGLLGQLQDEA